MSPTISVLMPVYNAEKYLSKAVESILTQTFGDFKFIIIDDGSTDTSLQILKEYDEELKGISMQRNRGVQDPIALLGTTSCSNTAGGRSIALKGKPRWSMAKERSPLYLSTLKAGSCLLVLRSNNYQVVT